MAYELAVQLITLLGYSMLTAVFVRVSLSIKLKALNDKLDQLLVQVGQLDRAGGKGAEKGTGEKSTDVRA